MVLLKNTDPIVAAMATANAIIAKGLLVGEEQVQAARGVSSRAIVEQRSAVAIAALAYAASRSTQLSKMCCQVALSRVGHAQA